MILIIQQIKRKVFTAGDMRRGQSLVVWAREGRRTAEAVNRFLLSQKKSLNLNIRDCYIIFSIDSFY